MPEKRTIERARKDARQGKSPTTQAGEFVREEIHHIREGKHGARSTKQAIAIGLSKARRAGVKLRTPKKGTVSAETRRSAARDARKGRSGSKKKTSPRRSRAVKAALKRESRQAALRPARSPDRPNPRLAGGPPRADRRRRRRPLAPRARLAGRRRPRRPHGHAPGGRADDSRMTRLAGQLRPRLGGLARRPAPGEIPHSDPPGGAPFLNSRALCADALRDRYVPRARARPRRHGDRLRGARRAARPPGRAQGSPRRAHCHARP